MVLLLSHAVQDVLIARRREEFINARRVIVPRGLLLPSSSFSVNDSGQLFGLRLSAQYSLSCRWLST